MIAPKNSEIVAKIPNSDPSPYEFARYLPWACSQYAAVKHNVYVTTVNSKELPSVRSLHKSQSRITKAVLRTVRSEHMEMQSSRVQQNYLNLPVLSKESFNIKATYDKFNKLKKVEFEKYKQVPLPVLRLFLCIAEYQPQLNYLIMRCKIDQQIINLMSKYNSCNITHLYLDDTFIPQANYYILLGDGTKLKELSLARCRINDTAVSLIAEKLAYPNGAARILTALNLSSNNISDFGAFEIAKGLRCNRKLIYLNLAGNKLTDDGAGEILNSLIAFPLTAMEKAQRLGDQVSYMLNKLDFFKELRKEKDLERERERHKSTSRRHSSRKFSVVRKNTAEYKSYAAKHKLQVVERKASEKKGSSEKKITSDDPNEEEMEKNPMRPFRSGELYIVHKELWSYGNNVLCYINFAYNDLTCFIIKKILEVLKRQLEYKRVPKGLIRVRLEGNRMPFKCREMDQVQAIFAAQFEGFLKPRKLARFSKISQNKF